MSYCGHVKARPLVVLLILGTIWTTPWSTSAEPRTPQEKSQKAPDQLSQPFVVEDSFIRELHSKANGVDYKLYIKLPEDYEKGAERYPVIFLLDADYSFLLARGITDHLSTRGHLNKTILVAVAYAGPLNYRLNRTRDYTPVFVPTGGYGPQYQKVSGGGDAFLDFFQKDLIPWTEREYRVQEGDRTLVGHSFGGLFATYALLNRPGLFQKFVIVSPSLWYDGGLMFRLEKKLTEKNRQLAARIYLAVGAREGNRGRPMVADLEKFAAALNSGRYPRLELRSEILPRETHNSVFPAALSNGLRFVHKGR